jgi:hypothetical protein
MFCCGEVARWRGNRGVLRQKRSPTGPIVLGFKAGCYLNQGFGHTLVIENCGLLRLFTTSLTRSATSRYLGLFFHDFKHTS